MKKTTKKGSPKASHKKVINDLAVKPGEGRTVRGGAIVKLLDAATPKLHE